MIVVVMVAERAVAPSAAAVVVLLSAVLAVLMLLVSLSWSCSECEEGVDGKRELGATSVSCIPFEAACSAADLLRRYRLYSSPRTSGAADDEGGIEERDEQPLLDLLGEHKAARALLTVDVPLGDALVTGTSAVHLLTSAPPSFLFAAATRA